MGDRCCQGPVRARLNGLHASNIRRLGALCCLVSGPGDISGPVEKVPIHVRTRRTSFSTMLHHDKSTDKSLPRDFKGVECFLNLV